MPARRRVREVTRRLGLPDGEALVNVAHADFTGQEQAEDSQPRLVGQRLEDAFHRGELFVHMRLDKYSVARHTVACIREGAYLRGERWQRMFRRPFVEKYAKRSRRTLRIPAAADRRRAGAAIPISSNLYSDEPKRVISRQMLSRSPSVAAIQPRSPIFARGRETVLDLGSGGGIDVLFSSRGLGPRARSTGST